jgi:hypothetical protein
VEGHDIDQFRRAGKQVSIRPGPFIYPIAKNHAP